jgi:hypothetical protein
MRRDFLGGVPSLPRHTANRVCALWLCVLALILHGYATADDSTAEARADDPSDRVPHATQPSTRQVVRTTATTTNPIDLPPLPDLDTDQLSQGAADAARRSRRRVVPGVAPTEVQRALDAGAGAGGVSLPRSAENAASQVQLQQGPSTGNVELLMKYLRIENEPVKIYGWFDNSYTQNTMAGPGMTATSVSSPTEAPISGKATSIISSSKTRSSRTLIM